MNNMTLGTEINIKGFKLVRLEVVDHNVLGSNIFRFYDNQDTPDSIYFSLVIGANGTGKSELLKLILWLFRNTSLLAKGLKPSKVDGMYRLNFINNGFSYELSNIITVVDDVGYSGEVESYIKGRPYMLKDGVEVDFTQELSSLPLSIVANSIMLTDKFIVPRNDRERNEFPMYKYLGVRNRPQQASTRSYIRKTVEYIVEQRDSSAFKNGLRRVTEFLGLGNEVSVLFYTAYTSKFFTGELTVEELDEYFDEMARKYERSSSFAPFKLGNYQSLRPESGVIEELVEFVNGLVSGGRLERIYRSSVRKIRYNVIDDAGHASLKDDYQKLDNLRRIGLLKAPEVSFTNQSEVYLQESSSGEFHFFSTVVGLMATMTSHSLVIIDEPEISLHPNWQKKYIHFLRKLFSSPEYETSQIIIATHSHFLVSDLDGKSANIVGLRKNENGGVDSFEFQKNTFGWGAEEVLYKVFGVRTSRNYYMEMNIRELLYLVSIKSQEKQQIESLIALLMEVELSAEDPLRKITSAAQSYLETI